MQTPKWGGKRSNNENQQVLLVYRLPAENECVIFFKNPNSSMKKTDQVKHVKKSLKITEELWQEFKAGRIDPTTHKIQYEDDNGKPSGRFDILQDVFKRIDDAGRIIDYKNVAAELLKGDGYLSYIPIVAKCFLKKGETTVI